MSEPIDTLERHRDELSETKRDRADKLARSITAQLGSLEVASVDELATKLDEGSLSQSQAKPIVAQMEKLQHLIESSARKSVDWQSFVQKNEIVSVSDIRSMDGSIDGNIIYVSKDNWVTLLDPLSGRIIERADLSKHAHNDLYIIGVTEDNKVLFQYDGTFGPDSYGDVFVWDLHTHQITSIPEHFNHEGEAIFDKRTQTLMSYNNTDEQIISYDLQTGDITRDNITISSGLSYEYVGRLSTGTYVFGNDKFDPWHSYIQTYPNMESFDEKQNAYTNPSLILEDGSFIYQTYTDDTSTPIRHLNWKDPSTGESQEFSSSAPFTKHPVKAIQLPWDDRLVAIMEIDGAVYVHDLSFGARLWQHSISVESALNYATFVALPSGDIVFTDGKK